MAVAPDGRSFVTTGGDENRGILTVWSFGADGDPPRVVETYPSRTAALVSVAFSPDGRTLAAGSTDGTIAVMDAAGGDEPKLAERVVLSGHSGGVNAVAFDVDGGMLATGGGGYSTGEVLMWDMAGGATPDLLATLGPYSTAVSSLSFSQDDGHLLATASETQIQGPMGEVVVWDVSFPAAPVALDEPIADTPRAASPVVFASNGFLATGNDDDFAPVLWTFSRFGGRESFGEPLRDERRRATTFAFTSDGHTFATGNVEGTVTLWDTSESTAPSRAGGLPGSAYYTTAIALTPDGRSVATADGDGVTVWDLSDLGDAAPVGSRLPGASGQVTTLVFSEDGRLLATGGEDGTVGLWASSGPEWSDVGTFRGTGDLTFNSDGSRLAVVNPREVAVWAVSTGSPPRQIGSSALGSDVPVSARSHSAASFSPDGTVLAAVTDANSVALFDLTGDREPTRIGNPFGDGNSVAISPDGRTLAVGGIENSVYLWDITDRQRPERIGRPLDESAWSGKYYRPVLTNIIDSMDFSADGRTLVTGSSNNVVLWDITDRIRPFRAGLFRAADDDDVTGPVAISADGRRLVTGADGIGLDDAAVHIFDTSGLRDVQEGPFTAACARGGNWITEQTWKIYAGDIPFQAPCR